MLSRYELSFLFHISDFVLPVDYLNINQTSDTVDDLPIREFLEHDDVTILAALNHGNGLVFRHNVPADENCVIFYKIPQIGGNQATTTDASPPPLGILTLEGGLTKSIYNSVSRIFSPHVTKVCSYSDNNNNDDEHISYLHSSSPNEEKVEENRSERRRKIFVLYNNSSMMGRNNNDVRHSDTHHIKYIHR